MKKILPLIGIVMVMALTASSPAGASTVDITDNPSDVYISTSPSNSYTHTFDTSGELPANSTIVSATIAVTVYDDNDPENEVGQVKIDDSNQSAINNLNVYTTSTPYVVTYTVPVTDFADHKVTINVASIDGPASDFYYAESVLTINYVPLPASVLLLGTGIIGLGAWGLRRRRHS